MLHFACLRLKGAAFRPASFDCDFGLEFFASGTWRVQRKWPERRLEGTCDASVVALPHLGHGLVIGHRDVTFNCRPGSWLKKNWRTHIEFMKQIMV